ncbi:MAG: hypothetical protein LM579_05185 [Thermodesulfobacterium sp.]|nr:hypothetical protein [Thermodesulfobacterium sp.]
MKMFLCKLFCCGSELTFYAIPKRHPERCEGCLANAWQDKKWGLDKTKEGLIGKTIKRTHGRTM